MARYSSVREDDGEGNNFRPSRLDTAVRDGSFAPVFDSDLDTGPEVEQEAPAEPGPQRTPLTPAPSFPGGAGSGAAIGAPGSSTIGGSFGGLSSSGAQTGAVIGGLVGGIPGAVIGGTIGALSGKGGSAGGTGGGSGGFGGTGPGGFGSGAGTGAGLGGTAAAAPGAVGSSTGPGGMGSGGPSGQGASAGGFGGGGRGGGFGGTGAGGMGSGGGGVGTGAGGSVGSGSGVGVGAGFNLVQASIAAGGGGGELEEIWLWFRDNIMLGSPQGQAQLEEYYALAPFVVEALSTRQDGEEILRQFYEQYIVPGAGAIQRQEFEEAHQLFTQMVAQAAQIAQEAMSEPDPALNQFSYDMMSAPPVMGEQGMQQGYSAGMPQTQQARPMSGGSALRHIVAR